MNTKEIAVKTAIYGFTGGMFVYMLISKYWYIPVAVGIVVASWLWWGTVKWILASVIGFYGVVIALFILLAVIGFVVIKTGIDPRLSSAADETIKSRLD